MSKRYSGIRSKSTFTSTTKPNLQIFGARVQYIILDDKTHPDIFKQFGEWNSVGGILFHYLNSPSTFKDISKSNFAKPLFPNVKNYPLENEVVYIISLPASSTQLDVNATEYYYFQPINLWNSVHHNAIPDSLGNELAPKSQTQDYNQVSAGSVRRVTDGSTDIPLGETFKEKIDIRNLLPFEGDIIYEGRWGQSLRFGSTVRNSSKISPWSSAGENGDPIIIIRNGQFQSSEDPWIPILEDINNDISSIYSTSTQKIPLSASSEVYDSYSSAPTKIKEYNESQIILNSNRIVFNSKKDHILLSSFKSINLNAKESVNIDTDKTIVSSKEIKLGSKEAKESVILGDSFLGEFKNFLKALDDLCTQLPTVGSVTPYTPNVNVIQSSSKLKVLTQSMLNKLDTFKSKKTKTE